MQTERPQLQSLRPPKAKQASEYQRVVPEVKIAGAAKMAEVEVVQEPLEGIGGARSPCVLGM